MNSQSTPHRPFVAGSKITDSWYFVGRREELDFLTSHISADQPTSINVVGERRIGKSSLLYHFCQTYEQLLQASGANPQQYVAIYLSLQEASCHTQSDFYQAVARKLRKRPSVQTNPSLTDPLSQSSFDNKSFAEAMFAWKDAQVLPILCLDKIEALFQYPQEFNNGFFDNLRSLLDGNALMVIIASYKKLDIYSSQRHLTSSFFNVGHVLPLGDLTLNEAEDLVRLPTTIDRSLPPALSPEKQQIALQWGGKHPYFLQLAGLWLWEANKGDRPLEWAKHQFDQQAKRVPGRRLDWRRIWHGFRWVILGFKSLLGVPQTIGAGVNKVIEFGIGFIVIVVVSLALLGLISWLDVSQQIKGLLCSTWGSAIEQWCQAK
ncbi:AAA-like domain-containing protein [Laspinema olomoucense]|uniref:AAA-like domain-containing protein n=1 Tax=Laspinema olomoucense TaxID=3231600 RepID=UPI0021BB4CF1|nr:AAA-like domain-containing protein [Laspinema sp. D3c]MCT7993035.1 AAA-like domain-containing protein [Laspinema sp. D3c]